MTPVPIDLPLRPSEAAAVASLIFEHADGRPLTEDLRNRLAGRASVLGLASLKPYLASLEPDPVHSSTYYMAVDGLAGLAPEPLLLHFAPATAPASALFPRPLLIGRMRPGGGREIIINATPFGPSATASIESFARNVAHAFLPRPKGISPALCVRTDRPAETAPAAFKAFRTILKETGRSVAEFAIPPDPALCWSAVWAAIRAGYRDGFGIAGPLTEASAALYTRFQVPAAAAVTGDESLRALRAGASFDLEIEVDDPAALAAVLDHLRHAGCQVQSVRVHPLTVDLPAACAAIKAAGALPSFRQEDGFDTARLTEIRHAASGRLIYALDFDTPDPALIVAAAEALR